MTRCDSDEVVGAYMEAKRTLDCKIIPLFRDIESEDTSDI